MKMQTINAVALKRELQKKAEQKLMLLSEKEQIQIRLYSIIYDAIEEIKQAMEGMLSPVIKEEIIGFIHFSFALNPTI